MLATCLRHCLSKAVSLEAILMQARYKGNMEASQAPLQAPVGTKCNLARHMTDSLTAHNVRKTASNIAALKLTTQYEHEDLAGQVTPALHPSCYLPNQGLQKNTFSLYCWSHLLLQVTVLLLTLTVLLSQEVVLVFSDSGTGTGSKGQLLLLCATGDTATWRGFHAGADLQQNWSPQPLTL